MFTRNKSGNLVAGRIAREPEEKTFDSGKSKTTFSVIYGEDKDQVDEQGRAKALFLNIDAWGAVGRDALLLQKGDYVICVGRLDSHEYNGKTYTTLVADAVWADMSAMMRKIASGVGDNPGNNSDNLRNPVPADAFSDLSDDDGELPF